MIDLPLYKTYENGWERADQDGFYTKTQLRKQGKALRKNQSIRAQIKNHYGECYNLYRLEESREKRQVTEKQRIALAEGRKHGTCIGCWHDRHMSKLRPFPHLEELQDNGHFTGGTHNTFCGKCYQWAWREWENYLDRQRVRQDAIHTAQELVTQKNTVYLDTETTGLGQQDRIVDIAIVDSAGEVLLNTLVNPKQHISSDVTAIHGITDTMVVDAPTILDLTPQLEHLLTGTQIVIYNVNFDRRMLVQSGFPACAEMYSYICAMNLYARWYGEWSKYHGNYKWQSLTVALQQCHLEFPETAHRAVNDAQATRWLLAWMAEREILKS